MNPFNIFNNRQEEFQLVVVLQSEHAYWFRWRGQELMGSWSEPMCEDSLNQPTRCPWVLSDEGGSACRVRLVFDTRLDEVDRVKVDDLSAGWMSAVQCRSMARRLRKDYPLASIHRLPAYAAPDVLSIVHHIIPPEWEEWLRQLQSQNVCITHAVTSLELLCECTRERPPMRGSRVSSDEKCVGPVLFDVPVGNERRHLLADGGVPLFMRVVDVPGEASHADGNRALQVSLQHVSEQITHDERMTPVFAPVSPCPELGETLQAASVLAALCVGSAVCLQRVSALPDEGSSMESGLQEPEASLMGRLRGIISKPVSWLLCLQDEQQQWHLTNSLRFSGDFLLASITRNKLHHHIRQLQKATLICAWMAAGSVVIASTHGINSARERARLSNEQHQLSEQVDLLSDSLSVLNDDPGFVVRSLARIEAHEDVKSTDAPGVLSIVASVIDEFPAIVLNRLSWSVMMDDQPADLAFSALSQVPQREQLWHAEAAVARLLVDISGTVTNQQGQGLREQQKALQSFVDHLQALPEVREVTVLEAPVNAARSSDRTDEEGSGYHLSLQLGGE